MLVKSTTIPTSLFLLAVTSFAPVRATQYNLAKEYSGSTFFNDWTFYNNYDNLTNGDAIFVSAQTATSAKLAYVDSSTSHAIIKVDNTTTVAYNDKRNTVRITSNDSFAVGSVWVTDLYHVPYGCSVWPAWWSQAPNWPTGGEIDTFEGVNMQSLNQMSLHTEPGCKQQSPTQSSTLVNSTDCSFQTNSNQGCIVTDPSTASFGQGFQGGAYVTEYASSGISIWFFPRSSIPSALSSNSSTIDTSTFGTPVANWPNTGCNIEQYFQPQQLIFDITLCGDFAGNSAIFNETCSGVCYNDYVIGSPSNYDNAYFEVGYVRVFSSGNTVITPSGTLSTPGSSSTGGSGSGSNGARCLGAEIMAIPTVVGLVALFSGYIFLF
ncbi:glycoside hydrolase family 16 protein [Coniophora puteana RWD-64-598 SS2]|uniref:Glycoside hydrolase family 16 protein n=1 Tax=Coniophora puteana (strain RWD-64-598) TaxID=741705 RepID=A0A5M3MQT6_CONPW|nr:glycoside hydrolase family 16 protein [Coniophora puteana RWD-64-598 SS2]EIW81094.1 glycoside hydrolase family 16 protein [Coniophora puteana RWD-64-598 SS2]